MSSDSLMQLKDKFQQLDETQRKRLLGQLKSEISRSKGNDKMAQTGRLSRAQNRLWILEQLNHCSYLYHIPVVVELANVIDEQKLMLAFRHLIKTYPVLTSTFSFDEERIRQSQNLSCEIDIQWLNHGDELSSLIEISSEALLAPFFLTPFNLEKPPLFRIGLLNTPQKSHLLMCFHHLLVDAWSVELMIQELDRYFQDVLKNSMVFSKSPESKSYFDFISWEQTQPHELDIDNHYWVQRLLGKRLTVDLMTDFPRKLPLSGQGKTIHYALPQELSGALIEQAKQYGLSINHLFLFAFQFLLSRYSGQDDIALGIPVAGRSKHDWYNTIGMFVNTCIHHIELDYDTTILEQINRIKKQFIDDIAHANEPFDEVIKALYSREQLTPNQSFNILYNFIPLKTMDHFKAISSTKYCVLPISKFDLSLHVFASYSDVNLFFEFSTDLYTEGTISELIHYYVRILESIFLNANETLTDWVWKLTQ